MAKARQYSKERVQGGESLPEFFMGYEVVVTGWIVLYDAVDEANELAKFLQMPVKHANMKQPSQFSTFSIVKYPEKQ